MWKDLSREWQTAFEEAWLAFGIGSIPIGAAIFDENGVLLVREHNRSNEPETLNKNISHAEANAIRLIDTSACNVREVTLYTTMEPCPMCMGTAVMSNIKRLRYAARDPYCGCVHIKDTEPYISGKGLDYTTAGGEPELVQLTIQSYHELRCIERGCGDGVLRQFAELSPRAVDIARTLYADRRLDSYAAQGRPFADVYDEILAI